MREVTAMGPSRKRARKLRAAAATERLARVTAVIFVSAALFVLVVVWEGQNRARPFPGAARNLEELGRVVLQALKAEDREALEAVRLTEAEHNEVVYPELPAARAANPFPVELAWENIQLRNARALRRVGDWYRRRPTATYRGTHCAGGTQSFDSFEVLTDCIQSFEVEGQVYEAQLYKDILIRGGGYKIFRYYDDRAQTRAAQ